MPLEVGALRPSPSGHSSLFPCTLQRVGTSTCSAPLQPHHYQGYKEGSSCSQPCLRGHHLCSCASFSTPLQPVRAGPPGHTGTLFWQQRWSDVGSVQTNSPPSPPGCLFTQCTTWHTFAMHRGRGWKCCWGGEELSPYHPTHSLLPPPPLQPHPSLRQMIYPAQLPPPAAPNNGHFSLPLPPQI